MADSEEKVISTHSRVIEDKSIVNFKGETGLFKYWYIGKKIVALKKLR